MDAKKPVPRRASCVPCGIEYPLRLTQKGCWSTSSTLVDDAPFNFDRLQDLSSICSKFRVPALPVFDPLEAIPSQGHPSRLSNPGFQYAASSCDTADLVSLGRFGDHVPSLPDEVSCMHTGGGERKEAMSLDQHALKKKGFINKKKKHVSRKPKEAKARWTAEEDG